MADVDRAGIHRCSERGWAAGVGREHTDCGRMARPILGAPGMLEEGGGAEAAAELSVAGMSVQTVDGDGCTHGS